MSTQEIKSEIQKILSSLPEERLPIILDYLKEVQQITSSKVLTSKNLSKILQDDSNLLKRLAE